MRKEFRTASSSSTMNTLLEVVVISGVHPRWYCEEKGRASVAESLAIVSEANVTPMCAHDGAADCQPHAHTGFFCGEKSIKYIAGSVPAHAWPMVAYFQAYLVRRGHFCPHNDVTVFRAGFAHGIHSIAYQV
jgi:hypothetical protein